MVSDSFELFVVSIAAVLFTSAIFPASVGFQQIYCYFFLDFSFLFFSVPSFSVYSFISHLDTST